MKGDPLERKKWKKSLAVPKKIGNGPFGIFQHPFCRKTAKKIEGDPLGKKNSEKKSRIAKKVERGDPLVSPGMVWYAEKQEIFLVQFARPNGAIWCNNIL